MNEELLSVQKNSDNLTAEKEYEIISLFPGIDLMYAQLKFDSLSKRYSDAKNVIQINYCKSGQIAYKMKNGTGIYLNSGDFSLHNMNVCADSAVDFPTGHYSGLTICIDLGETAANPPELLKGTDIFNTLQKRFCQNNTVLFFAENEHTEEIFSGFYHKTADLKLSYQKVKTLELLLYLYKSEFSQQNSLNSYQSEQVEIIREIHNRLIQKINERVTIEELSKEYLINPTTLKTAFKSVYGTSIAAHIKEHRMKKAAELLRDTDMSIAEIAQAVGYDSQSRFTAAFKAFFKVLPKEYKKKL